MNRQLLLILVTAFAIGLADESWAQQIGATGCNKKIQWGLQLRESVDMLEQSGRNEDIRTMMKSVIILGAFIQNDKASLDVNAGYSYIDAELNYKFFRNWLVVAGGSTAGHWLDIARTNYDYYYDYTDGDAIVTQYYFGTGYINTFWQRLKLKGVAKVGGVQTNAAEASGIIGPYQYYYETNKKAMKTDIYKLSPTFVYGGSLNMELLPRPLKNRKTPLVPFFNLRVVGNSKSNLSREVTIEEWVQGNVVYHEKSEEIKYNLLSIQAQFGIRWYFRY